MFLFLFYKEKRIKTNEGVPRYMSTEYKGKSSGVIGEKYSRLKVEILWRAAAILEEF